MLTKPSFLTLSLAAAAFASGCGGGGVPADELATEFEQSLCESQVACGAFPDLQTCRDTVFVEDSDIPQLLALVEAGRLDYDEDQAQECLDLFAGANPDCSVLGDPDFGDRIEEVCGGVFTGDAAEGEACYVDEECAGTAECEISDCQDQCCTGTCVAVTPIADAAIGESCVEADCVSGAYCNADNVCAALVEVGGACDGFGSCVAGALCDFDFQTNTGTCVELPDEGETCDPELFFGAISCLRIDNWCDPSDTTCKQDIAVGSPCDTEIETCVDYAYCNAGTCTSLPGEGGACDAELGPDCLGDLECVNQVCVAPESTPICTDIAS